MIALVFLVLVAGGVQGRIPRPTDCARGHNQVQTYCGVQFLCKCIKHVSSFYVPEVLNPTCAYQMDIGGDLTTFVPFVLNETKAAEKYSLGVDPEDNETEELDGIWDLIPNPPVYLDNAVPKRPTNGECQFFNQLPFDDCLDPATPGQARDTDDDPLYFQVRISDWRLRDTVINTIDQDYRMYYQRNSSSCYKGQKLAHSGKGVLPSYDYSSHAPYIFCKRRLEHNKGSGPQVVGELYSQKRDRAIGKPLSILISSTSHKSVSAAPRFEITTLFPSLILELSSLTPPFFSLYLSLLPE
eukprot:sb/3467439/